MKHYDADHRMSDEEVHTLTAAMQAPTAFNLQHWRFVNVQDPEIRKQIRAVAWDQAQVTDASLLLIMTGDEQSWSKEPSRFWKDAPQEVQDILVPAIDGYYKDQPDVQRDEVMRSCGIAGMTIMLAAKAMGYDSCPMDGFDFKAVAEIIKLPADHRIAFVAVGKGTRSLAQARTAQL